MSTTELLTLNADGTTTVHLVDAAWCCVGNAGEFRKMREALEGEQGARRRLLTCKVKPLHWAWCPWLT
jgi:hypothetical protein